MRLLFAGTACFAVAACGAPERADQSEASSGAERSAVRDSAAGAPAAPGIVPTAAPGVAFNYAYTFRLPAARISDVQEAHAAACEKLTVQRCRITGMHYRLVGEKEVSAMLAFKLDPAIARQFGKDGIAAVGKSEGMLVESEISGVDAGAAIAAADRETARLRTERARIEAQLAKPGLGADERSGLEQALATMRGALERTSDARDASAESLATTPMAFTYGSGELVPGFDARTPLRDAFATAGSTLIGTVALLIVIVSALLPWALLAALFGLAWRALKPRFGRWRAATPTVAGGIAP